MKVYFFRPYNKLKKPKPEIRMVKVGILFGGSSREHEISFAGGRTVLEFGFQRNQLSEV